MKFKESALAHKYLDGLKGIEIGGSAHNPFGLDTINVDYTDAIDTVFKQAEIKLCGEALKVDIVAEANNLPFRDETKDFIINSHLIEHLFDPISAIKEWLRVIKKGGYIFIICPHKDRIDGENRNNTTIRELIRRHLGLIKPEEVVFEDGYTHSSVTGLPLNERGHFNVWDTEAFLSFCRYLELDVVDWQDVDDKVGNGFTIVIKK
jgi:SAM-dependent methyltransferase